MKRINIDTGQPFRCGDIREDGFIFDAYQKSKMVKKTGYYKEIWRNPESHKREMARKKSNKKKKYDLISNYVNDIKLKKGCATCGYNENPIALDFHHFNKKMKENNVSSFFKTSWKQFEKIKDEIEKCEVYCANCHRIEEHRLREEQRLKEGD